MTELVEMITLYRFRIWQDTETKEYRLDDGLYTQEVPIDFLELFNQPSENEVFDEDKVFTVFTKDSENLNISTDEGQDAPTLLIFSKNRDKISTYIAGMLLYRGLDGVFNVQ